MFDKKFAFGNNENGQASCIRVKCGDLYKPALGYGFVTERNRREQELLRIPELNAAFDTVYWYRNEDMTVIREDGHGCFLDSCGIVAEYAGREGHGAESGGNAGERCRIPLVFKLEVPKPGNYSVTVDIENGEEAGEIFLFEGRRRLVFRGFIPAGGKFRHSFFVNVCDIIPRGKTEVYQDLTVDLAVVADVPRLTQVSVQEAECPTLYIAGDSTVTDQSAVYPYAPGASYAGWGQMLSAFLDGKIAVSNHSHSGLTTESFRGEGHYSVVEKVCRPGDYIFFQFGHNDQKLPELQAWEGYRENLCRYIEESRGRRMFPVLVTPVARNTWKGNSGCYNDLLEEYAQVCMAVGKETGTPVLDLHGYSCSWIKERGLEAVKPYFFPGDYTHTNDYGAWKMAGAIAREMEKVCGNFEAEGYRFLAGCVAKTAGRAEWIPTGCAVLPVKPECFADIGNPEEGIDPLDEMDGVCEKASRADALDILIKALHYFPVNVYNDMFDDIVGHEWYAGTVECAWQNGIIGEGLVENRHFYPEKEITMEEFLMLAVNAYKGRRHLPEEKECIYDSECSGRARPSVRAACLLGWIAADGSEELGRVLTKGRIAELCRKMII